MASASPADAGPMQGAILDTPRPTTSVLLARCDQIFAELLKRYENVLALARTEAADAAAAAVNKYQMQVEIEGLVKSVQSVHELTRTLKELWLIGPLNVIDDEATGEARGAVEAAEQMEKLADKILGQYLEAH